MSDERRGDLFCFSQALRLWGSDVLMLRGERVGFALGECVELEPGE